MAIAVPKSVLLGAALLAGAVASDMPGKAVAGTSCLDVALVLAVDSSASVSPGEYRLQQEGIASAFRDRGVLDAIRQAGRVAVSVVFWGSEGLPKPQSRWVTIGGKDDAEQFARTVESMPRQVTGDTGLGAGLLAALTKLQSLDVCSIRKIINVSGDGEETRAVRGKRRFAPPPQVRDLAESRRVEINALAISNEQKDLADYYSANVITGPDAFVMQAATYGDFAQALERKLIREISPRVVSQLPGTPALAMP
jgi:hypothetical protein